MGIMANSDFSVYNCIGLENSCGFFFKESPF